MRLENAEDYLKSLPDVFTSEQAAKIYKTDSSSTVNLKLRCIKELKLLGMQRVSRIYHYYKKINDATPIDNYGCYYGNPAALKEICDLCKKYGCGAYNTAFGVEKKKPFKFVL